MKRLLIICSLLLTGCFANKHTVNPENCMPPCTAERMGHFWPPSAIFVGEADYICYYYVRNNGPVFVWRSVEALGWK